MKVVKYVNEGNEVEIVHESPLDIEYVYGQTPKVVPLVGFVVPYNIRDFQDSIFTLCSDLADNTDWHDYDEDTVESSLVFQDAPWNGCLSTRLLLKVSPPIYTAEERLAMLKSASRVKKFPSKYTEYSYYEEMFKNASMYHLSNNIKGEGIGFFDIMLEKDEIETMFAYCLCKSMMV